jgi:hypothetical protein
VIVRIDAHGEFTVQVEGFGDGHDVGDVVVDGVSLSKALERGLGEEVVIYLEVVEVRVYGDRKAVITTKRSQRSAGSAPLGNG